MKRKNKLIVIVLMLILILSVTSLTAAYFADRVDQAETFKTSLFTRDGYTLKTQHPSYPFIAGEDVTVMLTERNDNMEDISSTITMTASWSSPDPSCKIFGNTAAADNATITIDGETVSYTLNTDGTITFVLPAHQLRAGEDQSRDLSLHIPESLNGTGSISFTYDSVYLKQLPAGFTTQFGNAEINESETHDFTVRVGWAASAMSQNNGKNLMGYLNATGTADQYSIQYEFAFGCTQSAMKDFTSKTASKWSYYSDKVVDLKFVEGMTTIGDYAFPDFTKITSLTLPESLTAVGTYAFDNISISQLTIPSKVTTFESMSFGHINELTDITFQIPDGTEVSFPTAGSSTGAFYVDPYVPTKILGPNSDAQTYDWITDQRRVQPILRAYEYVWTESAVDDYIDGYVAEQTDFHADAYRDIVKTAVFADANTYYAADNYAAICAMMESGTDTYTSGNVVYWNVTDPDHAAANPNAAYSVIAALDTATGALTIMADGGKVLANEDSSFLFSLFNSLESIDARKYDTSLATIMYAWHFFNDPPRPEQGEPDGEEIEIAETGAKQILGTETWDMSNVYVTSDMFHNAMNIESLDVSTWNTESLVYANGTFKGLNKVTKLDVSNWDMADVITITSMFSRCESLSDLPIENWDVGNIIDMEMAFSSIGACSLDLSRWNTASLTSLYQTFMNANITSLNVTGWDTSNVTTMDATFVNTKNLKTLDLSSWDTSNVGNADWGGMYRMFDSSGIETVNLTGFDFSYCDDVDSMFRDCVNLKNIIGEETWTNTSSWVSFAYVFQGCESLESLDVGNWDVSGVTGSYYGFNRAFQNCKKLKTLDVANWDVSKSKTFDAMFMNCESLESIDISKWDMSAMTYTSYASDMFNGCRSLTELTFPEAVNYLVSGMAANCPLLEKVTFLSTSAEVESVYSAGYTNEYNIGAFYVTPEDAAARYPDTGKIPTTIIAYGDGIASLVEGGYAFAQDNRDVGFDLPMLISNGSWYAGSLSRSSITSITISDKTAPASYDEAWDASVNQDGSIMCYLVGTDLYMVGNGSGKIYANPRSSYAFGSSWSSSTYSSVTVFNGLNLLDTTYARDMNNMFRGMSSVTALDVANFKIEQVTNIANMFNGCSQLTSLDLTNWNTDSLTNSYNLLSGCSSIQSIIIGAGITDFSVFQLRYVTSLTELTFLHGTDDQVTLPTAGSSKGAFYVSSTVSTVLNTENTMLLQYDWATDKRTIVSTAQVLSTPDAEASDTSEPIGETETAQSDLVTEPSDPDTVQTDSEGETSPVSSETGTS